jgi:hypothetical protein
MFSIIALVPSFSTFLFLVQEVSAVKEFQERLPEGLRMAEKEGKEAGW